MQRPTGHQRVVVAALAATALVVGFVEGVTSRGLHGRILVVAGFMTLVWLLGGSPSEPPD